MNIEKRDVLVTVAFWVAGVLALLGVMATTNLTLGFAVVEIAWFAAGFTVVRENERLVKILLGWPYAIAENGLTWVPYFPHNTRRYKTSVIEIDGFDPAGVVTRAGKAPGDEREYGPINVGVEVSLRFRWPEINDDLIKCVKMLPDPELTDELRDIFAEQLLDDVRNVGGKKTWPELLRDRKDFALAVSKSLREKATDEQGNVMEGNLIVDSKILDPTVAIAHIDIPQDIVDALHSEEKERRLRDGAVIKADAEKQTLEKKGEGAANAHRKMLDAIGDDDRSIRKQALLSLEKMAQGQATTIFPIPTDVMQALSGVLSETKFKDMTAAEFLKIFSMLPSETKKEFEELFLKKLAPQGGA